MLKHLGWPSALAGLMAIAIATAAGAETGGAIKGVVRDEQGQPLGSVRVTIDELDDTGRRVDATTDAQGAFAQAGLDPGNYRVAAFKDRFTTVEYEVRVRAGRTASVNFALAAGAARPPDVTSSQTIVLRRAFADGVAASVAGDSNAAIEKFTEAIALDPLCAECYYNLGIAYAQKQAYDQAESAFRKAIELRPDFADARESLANALYNLGVTEWNAGRVANARQRFEAATAANPEQAEAHYRLGMTLVNAGEFSRAAAEFATYLHLAPDGPDARQARDHLLQLKKKPH